MHANFLSWLSMRNLHFDNIVQNRWCMSILLELALQPHSIIRNLFFLIERLQIAITQDVSVLYPLISQIFSFSFDFFGVLTRWLAIKFCMYIMSLKHKWKIYIKRVKKNELKWLKIEKCISLNKIEVFNNMTNKLNSRSHFSNNPNDQTMTRLN